MRKFELYALEFSKEQEIPLNKQLLKQIIAKTIRKIKVNIVLILKFKEINCF